MEIRFQLILAPLLYSTVRSGESWLARVTGMVCCRTLLWMYLNVPASVCVNNGHYQDYASLNDSTCTNSLKIKLYYLEYLELRHPHTYLPNVLSFAQVWQNF
jgi:hypothetical protein